MGQHSRAEKVAAVTLAKHELCSIPNVGPATASDLLRLGIRQVEDLVGADPDALYERLGELDGRAQDPCVRDVLAAAIAYAQDGTVEPWWHFTKLRKRATAGQADAARP